MSHSVLCTSNYYIINENEKEIKYSTTTDPLTRLLFYYITLLSSFLILKDFYNLLSQSPMFPISSSSCYFIHKNGLWLTLANGFLFHCHQFSSSFFQYSCSYFLSSYSYNIFAVYFPGSSLLNILLFSSAFCHLASSSSTLPYLLLNSFTNSLTFLRFSWLFQVSSSTVCYELPKSL